MAHFPIPSSDHHCSLKHNMLTNLASAFLFRTLLCIVVVVAAPMDLFTGSGSLYSIIDQQQPEQRGWMHSHGPVGNVPHDIAGNVLPGVHNSLPAKTTWQPTPLVHDSVPWPVQAPATQHSVQLSPSSSWTEPSIPASYTSHDDFIASLFQDEAYGQPGWSAHTELPEVHGPAVTNLYDPTYASGLSSSLDQGANQRPEIELPRYTLQDQDDFNERTSRPSDASLYPRLEPKRFQKLIYQEPQKWEPRPKLFRHSNRDVRARINREAFDEKLTWVDLKEVPNLGYQLIRRSPHRLHHRILSGLVKLSKDGTLYMVNHRRSSAAGTKGTNLEKKPFYSFWWSPKSDSETARKLYFFGFGYVDAAKIVSTHAGTRELASGWARHIPPAL